MQMDLMISILNSLINLCLIYAVWKLLRRQPKVVENVHFKFFKNKKLDGKLDKYFISAKIAEKFAERAFNMASAANLGVVALQKAMQQPRLATKQQLERNQLAKNSIDKLFTTEGNFDFLRPILSDEENDLLDEMEKHKLKNGSVS